MALSVENIIQSFEDQRRRGLLRLLIPIGIVVTGIAIISGAAVLLQGKGQAGMQVTVGLSCLLIVCMVISALALRREQVEIATTVFVVSAVVTVLGIVTVLCVATDFSAQSLVQLACLSIVVSIAGAVGNIRSILFASALESLVIILVLLLVPARGILTGASGQERFILIIGTLTYHWAIAALLIAVAQTLRRSVVTLSQTYDELSQARQVDELKDQFITQVNHELRTPIMSLQGYVDLIYELGTLSEADRKIRLERARAAGETLTRFVNDVLDTRRVDQDTEFESVATPLRPAIADALLVLPPNVSHPVQVDVEGELIIWGEPTRLLQILTNLISNAVKYSPPGASIEITAHALDQMVEIAVQDHGLGIPPEQAAALFHRFVRLERDLRSSVRGTGVGLYLCKMYAEAMGGTIAVESSGVSGEGSRFIVQLPLATVPLDTQTLTPTRKLERTLP